MRPAASRKDGSAARAVGPDPTGKFHPMAADYLQKILTARVYDVAIESPLDIAKTLSRRLGNQVLLKREDQQPVFSFKLRGAYNKMAHLSPEALKRGNKKLEDMPRYIQLVWNAAPDIKDPNEFSRRQLQGGDPGARTTFTQRSLYFLLIIISSTLQLVAFSTVLWSISHELVYFLVFYATLGTCVVVFVFGQRLMSLNFNQLRREADFG